MAPKRIACCRECAKPLEPRARKRGEAKRFCSVKCKAAWNNRRKTRGADLYDLFMAVRYQRDEAKRLGLWTDMCRLAEQWNDQDIKDGRVTYTAPGEAIARLMDRGAIRRANVMRI